MEKLTCAQAKQIDLVAYLSSLGYQPSKINQQDYWYLSPLREEKTPSFKVNRGLNIWYDHGQGKGGSLIDFGIHYFKCSISDLLHRLSDCQKPPGFSFHQPLTVLSSAGEKKEASGSKILILQSLPLTSKSLLSYLEERKIPIDIATLFCKEVDFLLYEKKYTVIGFANNSGGFELRSENFKGSSSPKDISLIVNNADNKSIHVLEGFTDFLSVLVLKPHLQNENFLVLNSLSFFAKSLGALKEFSGIYLYLDQDTPGRKATDQYLKALPQAQDVSLFYSGHKDLNDYVRQGKREAAKEASLEKNNRAFTLSQEKTSKKETQYKKGLKM